MHQLRVRAGQLRGNIRVRVMTSSGSETGTGVKMATAKDSRRRCGPHKCRADDPGNCCRIDLRNKFEVMSANVIAEFAFCETHKLLFISPFTALNYPPSFVRFVPPGPGEHILFFFP